MADIWNKLTRINFIYTVKVILRLIFSKHSFSFTTYFQLYGQNDPMLQIFTKNILTIWCFSVFI